MPTTARTLLAKDMMVTQLVTLRPDMDVFDAIGLLLKHRISGAPVLDSAGRYLGIFSERSSISLLMNAAYDSTPDTTIAPFVDVDAAFVRPDTDLLTLMERFLSEPYRRLPVLDEDNNLLGQVSRRDILRVLHKQLEPRPNVGTDSSILFFSSVMERADSHLVQTRQPG